MSHGLRIRVPKGAAIDKELTRLSFLAKRPFTYIQHGVRYTLQPRTVYHRMRHRGGRVTIQTVA